MDSVVYVYLLLAVPASALPLNDNQGSSYEVGVPTVFNATSSPFLKILRTSDITVRDAIYSSPTIAFIGTNDKLLRCLHEDPNECEVFYKVNTNIYSLVISEDNIYAGLDSGVILRCNIHKIESCENFQRSETHVMSLAVVKGHLYVGLYSGTILRCQLHESNNCQSFHVIGGGAVYSLIHFNGYIYAGSKDGNLMRCSLKIENICTQLFNMGSSIYGFSNVENSIIAVTSNGRMWNCSQLLDTSSDYCVSLPQNYLKLKNVASFNGVFYPLDQEGINVCRSENVTDCSKYGNFKNAWSMAMVYGVHHMQSRYKNEDATCIWQSGSKCPPTVTYYNAQQRALLQVHVKNGRLYNSFGILVDTSDADEGSSGPRAIFAMGPDGIILLSNRHISELIHTSSLFAGSPVSGAGEMVVKNGVIEEITTCSDHYQPDLDLNRQVIQSLRAQGYTETERIHLRLCGDNRELDQTVLNGEQ